MKSAYTRIVMYREDIASSLHPSLFDSWLSDLGYKNTDKIDSVTLVITKVEAEDSDGNEVR